jgi:L-ascorbate metabolism protein UlaG (beta-lactamase superfamily)
LAHDSLAAVTMRRLRRILTSLLVVGVLLAAATWAVFQLPAFGGRASGARLARMRASPQFIGDRFENTPPQDTDTAWLETLRLYRQGFVRTPTFAIPVLPIGAERLAAPAPPGVRAFWFGHATVLVEIDGVRILTDPVLSERVSPVPIGPTRFHAPPIALASLTGIDAVVISHDHYDHLDMATVQHLATRGTHFYVGLGIGAHLERWQVPAGQIHEMDWWDTADVRGVRITCAPSRHYSGRRAMDNSTLWSSWVLRGRERAVYFSGDTGYGPHFSDIRQRLGPVDLTLMKVGAYGDTWLDIHMDPESAVRAHQDLGADVLLPIHWATFDLSYHAWDEPIVRTLRAASGAGVQVVTPRVGEPVEIGAALANTDWYARQGTR